jgi:hypothetical protein
MIRILWFDDDGQMRTDLTPEDLREILARETGTLWVDLAGAP